MTKIDVLAVMDDAAAILAFDDNTVTARILGEARAAVAEMIEASTEYHEAIGAARTAMPGSITTANERAAKADKRLRAAIDCIGGAA